MALVVKYGADTLANGGSTALGNVRDNGLPFLRLDVTNDALPILTGVHASVTGDVLLGGFDTGYQTLSDSETTFLALELNVSAIGAGSGTITITHDTGSWSHTFTFTVVAGSSLVETVTFENFAIMEQGDKFEALFSVPAQILINAQTTISATSNGDDILLTIADSANGLGTISPGDQIYMSGWTSADNNLYWMAMAVSASTAKLQTRAALGARSVSENYDGITEAAGNAITISRVPTYTNPTTMGTFTVESNIEPNRTATVKSVHVWHDVDHRVYISVKGNLDVPVSGDEILTVSATANTAWVLEYGQGNEPAADGYSFQELFDTVWYAYTPTNQNKDQNGLYPGAVQPRPAELNPSAAPAGDTGAYANSGTNKIYLVYDANVKFGGGF